MEKMTILALGGDGIGPEVVQAALRLLEAMAPGSGIVFDVEEDLLHGQAWDTYGTFCRDETLAAAKAADAVLVGAVGGPKWDAITVPGGPEMQDGLMRLRKELDTYVGLRPAKAVACLEPLTPYRPGLLDGADIMVVREMSGGIYFSEPRGIEELPDGEKRGYDTASYTASEIERIARAAFELAARRRGKLVSTDKANVMESGVVWRDVVESLSGDYPSVTLTHMYADNAVYQIGRNPAAFDVILGDNLFGDIISDQAGVVAGSLGMLPSACLHGLPKPGQRHPGIYEPVHGTAPDIAGQGIANPIGMLLSLAMMFEYACARPDLARRVETAVVQALEAGHRTPDLGGESTTLDVTDAVIAAART